MNKFYDYYIDIFRSKYVRFSGRASRGEFWYFTLFNIIVSTLAVVLDIFLGTSYTYDITLNGTTAARTQLGGEIFTIGYISLGYVLIALLPMTALHFRRLHDIGKSAWWLLIFLVPLIGPLVIFYYLIKAGNPEENKYGPNPLTNKDMQSRGKPPHRSKNQELKKKSSLGMKIFKFIGITLIVIFVLAGALFLTMGSVLGVMAKQLIEEVDNKEIIQRVEKRGKEASITLPLETKYEILYRDIKLCKPEGQIENMLFEQVDAGKYSSSSICANGNCEVSVGLENSADYPRKISAYVKDNGACVPKSIPTTSKPSIQGYNATMEMTPDLLSMLHIVSDEYKVSASHTKNYSTWQFLGTKKVSFTYKKARTSDTLLIDGKKSAKLLFTATASPTAIRKGKKSLVLPKRSKPTASQEALRTSNKLKRLEEKIEVLKQEKRVLMMKLDINK